MESVKWNDYNRLPSDEKISLGDYLEIIDGNYVVVDGECFYLGYDVGRNRVYRKESGG